MAGAVALVEALERELMGAWAAAETPAGAAMAAAERAAAASAVATAEGARAAAA